MSTLTSGRIVLAACLALLCSSGAPFIRAQTIAAIPHDPSELSSSTTRAPSFLDIPVDSIGKTAASGSGIVAVATPPHTRETGVDWLHLMEGSLSFLAVEHVFRYSSEYGTRDAFHTPFFPGYFDSVA